MAEDKEQDLSMEDILSSIKNILSEDEQGKEVPAATPQPEPVAEAAAVSPEPEEEILELSPAMRITDDNADTGYPCDCRSVERLRIPQFLDAFGDNDAYGYQQDNGIEQRYQYGAFFITVGIICRRLDACQPASMASIRLTTSLRLCPASDSKASESK